MKYVLFLLLLLSLGCNVLQFQNSHNGGESVTPAGDSGPSPLYVVAEKLGVKDLDGKSDAEIASDIKIRLQEAVPAPKATLSEETVKDIGPFVSPEEKSVLEEINNFAGKLKGRRVLVLPQ